MRLASWAAAAMVALAGWSPAHAAPAGLEAAVRKAMAETHAQGLATAVIEGGRIVSMRAYGLRNVRGDPLRPTTVMYGASLTKAVVGYIAMQLVDEGVLDLDRPLAAYLPKPLPEYGNLDAYENWGDLKDDARWRRITARHVLSHATGFANYSFVEPDGKLRLHFDPGARYGYSGAGMLLLQFALEKGLGLDLQAEAQRRVFDRFGMRKTGLVWRTDFAEELADAWQADGKAVKHDDRSRARASGSMDTTLDDFARFAAGFMRGEGLSARARAEMLRPQLAITTRAQFPTLQPEAPPALRWPGLAAGLGVVLFQGPRGRGFFKGGHDDQTANLWVCVERRRRCVALLSNDVRAEAAYPALVRAALGDIGFPARWEYGDPPAPKS